MTETPGAPLSPYTVLDLTRARSGSTCVRQLADLGANVKEVFENEQIRHLGMAVPIKHPALGELRLQRPPSTLSRTPASIRTHSPDVGEHTDEILGEIGYSKDDIARLRRDQVV